MARESKDNSGSYFHLTIHFLELSSKFNFSDISKVTQFCTNKYMVVGELRFLSSYMKNEQINDENNMTVSRVKIILQIKIIAQHTVVMCDKFKFKLLPPATIVYILLVKCFVARHCNKNGAISNYSLIGRKH